MTDLQFLAVIALCGIPGWVMVAFWVAFVNRLALPSKKDYKAVAVAWLLTVSFAFGVRLELRWSDAQAARQEAEIVVKGNTIRP